MLLMIPLLVYVFCVRFSQARQRLCRYKHVQTVTFSSPPSRLYTSSFVSSTCPNRCLREYAGKGKGLIGLFCGRPGCGKTLTAEAVADLYQVPLYVVTAGELGIEPDKVDKKLADIFRVAKMWNAVVLIDEAEVFLQQRTASDIKRNALVTIFLRQLEYYQGILILTTNLLDQCDAALESELYHL